MIEQIVTETLQERVYATIKDSIMKNELLPGQPLLIDKLAQDLGVSPTPVREAVARLAVDGLVERTQNKTALVAGISAEDVRQVYEVRRLLEPHVASLVAKKCSVNPNFKKSLYEIRKDAEGIQEILAASIPLTSSQYETYLGVGLRLQEVILEALGDTLLEQVLSLVGNHSLRIRSFAEASSTACESKILHVVNNEHLAILDALLDGDQKRVMEAVRKHLSNAEARTIQAFKKFMQS